MTLDKFMSHNPTHLGNVAGFHFFEHPLRGDELPIYMVTPDKRLINTQCYDLEDLDLESCLDIAANA